MRKTRKIIFLISLFSVIGLLLYLFGSFTNSEDAIVWKYEPVTHFIKNYSGSDTMDTTTIYALYNGPLGLVDSSNTVTLKAVNAKNGKLLWEKKVNNSNTYTLLKDFILSRTYPEGLELISKKDGNVLWKTSSGFFSEILGENDTTLFLIGNPKKNNPAAIVAMMKRDGSIQWKHPLDNIGEVSPSYFISNAGFYIIRADGTDAIQAINPETGNLQWMHPLKRKGQYLQEFSPPILTNNKLDFCTFLLEEKTGYYTDTPGRVCNPPQILDTSDKVTTTYSTFTSESVCFVDDCEHYIVGVNNETGIREFRKRLTSDILKENDMVYFISQDVLYAAK